MSEQLAGPVGVSLSNPSRSRARRIVSWGAGLAFLLLGLGYLREDRGTAAQTPVGEPGAVPAAQRDLTRTLRFHGVVEAARFYTVAAPRLVGPGLGNLVITHLVPNGSTVRRGELLVEFDRQDQIKTALDRQAEYRDLEEQIKKKRAEHAAAQAGNETDLQLAENALATAELEMRKNEVLSRIDAEKNRLNLEEAQARLDQLGSTLALRQRAREAELRILEIQRDRARNAMLHAQANAEKMAIHSPLDGIAVLNPIWKGGQMAEVQEGDEVRAGVPFLQVVDPSAMQVRARVNQADVRSLHVGQAARIGLDAYSQLQFPGRIERIATIGLTSSLSDKVRFFTVEISIQGSDPQLLPDLSAAVDVELESGNRGGAGS